MSLGCLEFNTCPTGSPPEGFNASDSHLNYVNAFPVNSVRFGIQTLSPKFFGGAPDFVVSGPNVGIEFVNALLAAGPPFLPPGTSVNVNYPLSTSSSCTSPSDFSFILTRIAPSNSATDVETCGTDHLPRETAVVATNGCFASVSVMNATTKTDVNATTQAFVLGHLGNFLSCLS
ncbi:hypothetical protein DFH05DRAFT_1537710 [Lentinula detonsa]|uniref:Sure-like protein n=1 Tax=Lentinula detonsa TaxID=2804962 RepID=A0A9W8TU14_9AGAR|nr:hypothetical protein DFH05DRAFT_1537710 [Lentinula detonsa]